MSHCAVPKTYEQETPKDIPAPTPSTPPAAAQKAEKPESKAAGGDDIFSLINSCEGPFWLCFSYASGQNSKKVSASSFTVIDGRGI